MCIKAAHGEFRCIRPRLKLKWQYNGSNFTVHLTPRLPGALPANIGGASDLGGVPKNMKKALIIFLIIFLSIIAIGVLGIYVGITNEMIVVGGEYSQGIKYDNELQEKVIAKLKERNISYIINNEDFITHKKKDKKRIQEIADKIILASSEGESFIPSKPGTYFYPDGANEYFISLLKNHNIHYNLEYDENHKIKNISWELENNRTALEQALKVQEKIGQTKTPPSIQMLSPEMNDRFEEVLSSKGISFTRKGNFTVYEWKDWVEVEILKKDFYKKELSGHITH